MRIFSTFKIALKSLTSNKTRTGLAILGVTIGMASVIIVFSAGNGIDSLILGQVESFGADTIQVEIKVPSTKKGYASEQQSAANLAQGVQITTLTLDDIDELSKLTNVRNGYGAIMSQEPFVYTEEMRRFVVLATSASYIDIDTAEIGEGRFFTDAEDRSLSRVVVLGSKVKEKLFGDNDPIGKSIKIRQTRFRVIGVMKERGAVMSVDFDDFAYVPVRTMQKIIMGTDYIQSSLFKIRDISIIEQTAEDMRFILRENHDIPPPTEKQEDWSDTGKDDFRVMPMTEIMEVWGSMTKALTALLLAIVAVSVIVGGVGIMNVMYVIINERTSEIGLRKALGATYFDIISQFLIESVLITTMGGLVGVIFGVFVSYLISIGAQSSGLDWKFGVPLKAFLTAFFFSLFFGVVFGAYPARRAARMDPSEALRAE